MRINGASFFKQSFELKIKGDLIPEAAAEEIIGELQALFARHNAGAAQQRTVEPKVNPQPFRHGEHELPMRDPREHDGGEWLAQSSHLSGKDGERLVLNLLSYPQFPGKNYFS